MQSLFHQVPPIECKEFEKRVKHGQSMEGETVMGRVKLGETRGMFPIKGTKHCPRVPKR